jgi:hypothetical protein
MAFIPAVAAVAAMLDIEEDGGKSPVLGIHRQKQWLGRPGRQDHEVKFRKNQLRGFLLSTMGLQTDCIDIKNNNRPTKCRCMAITNRFSESEALLAVDYLFGYGVLPKAGQQSLLTEWIKYSDNISHAYKRGDSRKRTCFLLPGTTHLICKDALCLLLGMGKVAWKSVATMAKNNVPPSHGLSGHVGNKFDETMEELMKRYFEELLLLAQPRETLVIRSLVRDMVVTELREDDQDIVELPSHMTKRSLYDRLLLQVGWKYTYDSKGRIIHQQEVEGTEQQKAPAWSSFRRYWAKHHPKLFIAGAREDVCNQCYIFANRHRYASRKKKTGEENDVDEDDDEVQGPPVAEDDANEDEDLAAMVNGEEMVMNAARHVEMAQQQRSLYQRKRQAAINTAALPPEERVLCYVADYAQNMYIPNFAGEQPGATYYYSPMSCYVFGVVDAAIDKLSAYMYTEDTAKKGGNNVASLLMYHLDNHGIPQQATAQEPFKELNFIMDNCGGQNKNRHVLRLMHFIVKRRIAKKANAIFLVRGHTKNACDRLFNTMKKQYRKVNSFTPEDLLDSIKGNLKVDPFMITATAFKDWDKLEDQFIKRLPGGNTTTNHIFSVDINRNNGNSMFLQESDGSDEKEFKLVKEAFILHDAAFWEQQQPLPIAAIGLPDIKWKELHHKWAPYVPVEKKQQWKYYHEAPPLALIKEVAKQSKRARQQRQTRGRTVHDGNAKPPEKKQKLDPKEDNDDPPSNVGAI